MRAFLSLMIVGIAAAGLCRADQFSASDRDAAMAFWSAPGRYTTTVPDDVLQTGLWQVRLTVAGSQWLWNYQRGKHLPPTQNPVPQTDQQKAWETWIQAKLAKDRWVAMQVAQDANEKLLGRRLPLLDKDTPTSEPPSPGQMPADLFALCGDAPIFAEAVVPMQHTVKFDDETVSYRDNIRLSNPRYAYYRFENGVMSIGTPAKNVPESKLKELCKIADISDTEARVMKAVSMLEGGFDSVNTYDTGYVSVGFIQFASLSMGAGSLGEMLASYKRADPDHFQADFRRFGIDVTPDNQLDVLDLSTGAELVGPDANRAIIRDKRLIAIFQRAGQVSDAFMAAQLRAAKEFFLPANDTITLTVGQKTITGVVSDFVKSEAGLAVLMDRKVNTGKLDPLPTVLQSLADELDIRSLSDLAPYEHDIILAVQYRKDYFADTDLSQPAKSPTSRFGTQLMSRGSQGRNGRGGGSQR